MSKMDPSLAPIPTYWKARLTRANHHHYWAYTQSVGLEEIHFQSEQLLHERDKVLLQVQAIHNDDRKHLHIKGEVLSCILLSSGNMYGIDLKILDMPDDDREYLEHYLRSKHEVHLRFSY